MAVGLVGVVLAPEQWMLGHSEVPKVALVRSAAAALMALWALEWAFSGGAGRSGKSAPGVRQEPLKFTRVNWVWACAFLFLGATFLSTVFSPIWRVSLWGHDPGFDGYSFYNIASYVAIFAVIATHVKSQAQAQRILWAVVLSGTAAGGYAIAQHFGNAPFLERDAARSTASMGNPIFAGSFLLMTILATMAASLWMSDGKRMWWPGLITMALLTAQMAGLAFTLSRGPWVGTAVGVAAFLGATLVFCGGRRFCALLLVVMASAGMAFAITLLPTGGAGNNSGPQNATADRAASIYGEVTSGSFTGRMNWWRQTANLILNREWYDEERFPELPERPSPASMYLLGTGPESLDYVLPLAETSHTTSGRAGHAHNFILQDLAELGILGLMSRLAFLMSLSLACLVWLLRSRGAVYPVWLQSALILTCSIVMGRTVEQLVGVPRVADTSMFWALSGLGVAAIAMAGMTGVVKSQTSPLKPQRSVQVTHWKLGVGVAATVGCLVFVWQTNINHLQAAMGAASSERSLESGDLPASAIQIDKSVRLTPDVGPYQIRRALALKRLSDETKNRQEKLRLLTEGYKGLEAAVAYNPMDHRVWARLGEFASYIAQMDARWHEKSVRNYEVLAQLLPKYWQSHTVLASAQLQARQPKAALATLQTSTSLASDASSKAQTLYLLGWALRDLGQMDESAEALEASISMESSTHAKSMLEEVNDRQGRLVSRVQAAE